LDPKFAGSNPAEDDGFSRAIEIRNKTFFGRELKPSADVARFRGTLKIPAEYDRYLASKINGHFSPSFSLLPY
jgi:hypothetical protein